MEDMDMARGLLSQDMVMLSATHTEAPRVCMDTMEDMAMEDMDMARGLLSQDMVMLSATTTEAPRVFMDTMEDMDMVVIMARDLLMLDTMAMEWLGATSRLTDHTLPTVSVLL